MAAGNFEQYHNGLLALLNGSVAYASDTIRMMLLTNAYTPTLATEQFVSEIVANEVAASGNYSRQDITGGAVSLVSGKVRITNANVNFGSDTTITAKRAVIYKFVTNDAASPLLFVCDLETGSGTGVTSTNGTFAVNTNANGITQVTPNAVPA